MELREYIEQALMKADSDDIDPLDGMLVLGEARALLRLLDTWPEYDDFFGVPFRESVSKIQKNLEKTYH